MIQRTIFPAIFLCLVNLIGSVGLATLVCPPAFSKDSQPPVLLSISPGLRDVSPAVSQSGEKSAGPEFTDKIQDSAASGDETYRVDKAQAVDKLLIGQGAGDGVNQSPRPNSNQGWIAPVSVKPETHFGLSDDTFELAKLWGLVPSLNTLHQNPRHLSEKQMDVLLKRVVVRQDISESVLSKMFDVRTTLNSIDKQIAKSEEISAILAEKRDKAIRFNTYADLVAGGITGILSGALRLGTLEFVTPDVVDVVEGVAQAGLAGYALKNENIKHHIEKGIPNLLAKIFYPHEERLKDFPDSVWTFLNSIPSYSDNDLTRRELLVKQWTEKKFCLRHRGGKKKTHHIRVKHVAGVHGGQATLTIELLEDRIAMLQDLRSEVTTMEEHLAEIFERAKKY